MIFENENIYLGKSSKHKLFNLKEGIIEKAENLTVSSKSEKFSNFLEYNERIIRLLNFIDNFNGNVPSIFGRIYYIKNNDVKVLNKEFFSFDSEKLEENIGRLYGQIYIEFIVLDSTLNLKDIIDYCKLNKVKYSIYHLFDIEDNDIYLSSKFIHRLYIPDYILNFINKKD